MRDLLKSRYRLIVIIEILIGLILGNRVDGFADDLDSQILSPDENLSKMMPTSASDASSPLRREIWPDIPFSPEFRTLVEEALLAYPPDDHRRFLQDDYSPTGQYLNFYHQTWPDNDKVRFDRAGIPQGNYGGTFYDHPVILCRYALNLHGRYVRGETHLKDLFLRVVERLLARQDARGAFTYPFAYYLYGYQFAPGWASAMAQGMGLSVLRRAYDMHRDRRYISAGNRAVRFLHDVPVEQGGVKTSLADLHPSLSGYLWLEEFPTQPANYKLNGFIFTLIGLYDWWQRDPEATEGSVALAGQLFAEGIRTLEQTLAYFDLRGFTCTDMRYLVAPGTRPRVSTGYHRVHIYQLHLLARLTGSTTLRSYEKLWRWYVEEE